MVVRRRSAAKGEPRLWSRRKMSLKGFRAWARCEVDMAPPVVTVARRQAYGGGERLVFAELRDGIDEFGLKGKMLC